ncbi:hypothetical protein F2P81_023865 [Scophthalmus maximus]|uniref:Chromogranin B n=1 Tax=Scophthalmus maximus TaxID=52904 RepID=A0A6A4RST3_SCOMX|nr:hypothetical protein F2P81_023865 [Scophthalmus maximus]
MRAEPVFLFADVSTFDLNVVLLLLLSDAENLAFPVGAEGQREDVVTKCLVEVLSKALSKPDAQLHQECRDILQAGVKHAPLDKKSVGGIATHEEEVRGRPEDTEAQATDVKDIEALLKSVEDKRENPEDERSQESWSLGDEKEKRLENDEEVQREKRGSWRPGRYHQRPHKRDEEPLGEEREEPEEERSQEAWDVDKRHGDEEEERNKRIWKPTHRYHHKKKLHKRGDGPSEEKEDEDRSQESWGLDERDKRNWRPGRYHQRRQRRDEDLSEEAREEPDEERSQESWDFDTGREKRNWRPGRYHQRRQRRDEELAEDGQDEADGERSQESWDFDTGREKRNWRPGRYHQRRQRRDEELAEGAREEPDEERSQESWDFDTGREKKNWRPGRYHQRRQRRDEELAEDGERSQESWDFDKRQGEEEGEVEKRIWKPTHRYHHKKKIHKRAGGSSEEEEEQRGVSEESEEAAKDGDEDLRYLAEKRNPWIYRGYYHPAWFKRDSDEHAAPSNKMDELAKLVSYKMNRLANHSNAEEVKRITHPRALTPQEDKKLESLAAMDMELQKIAAKLHDNSA